MLRCTPASLYLLSPRPPLFLFFFFFNDTATTEIYTLSLHDALPICQRPPRAPPKSSMSFSSPAKRKTSTISERSEEHTSELQSHSDLVCRLLLEKKKNTKSTTYAVSVSLALHFDHGLTLYAMSWPEL